MRRGRLTRIVREWIGPSLVALAGAAVVIAGAEIGGVIGWTILGLAACAVVGVVVWAVWSYAKDYPFGDWPEDDDPPNA